jgi:murein L,D-transpeptidase YafK
MRFFFKNRRYTIPPFLLIGVPLVLILLVSVFVVFHFYIRDQKQREMLIDNQVQETKKKLEQLHVALAKGDMKKAYTELAQAQKSVNDLLPRATEPEPKKGIEVKQNSETPAAASSPSTTAPVQATGPAKPAPSAAPTVQTIAEDEGPAPFLLAEKGEYLLACEKDLKMLHLFRYLDGRFKLVKSYPCIVGANHFDKKREGDFATPVGTYFFLRYIPGKSLAEKYGHGAFVLNYPNFLDRKTQRQGTGIWLHGHSPAKALGEEELQNTSGCIVINNDALKELTEKLKANGTPIVVVNRLEIAKLSQQRKLADELVTFMKSWSKSWESGNVKKFMVHYSPDFINSDGMNYHAFKLQKERVNRGKKFIRVTAENPAILLPQEKGGKIAVIRFHQRYSSSNYKSDSKKLFYLTRGEAGWRISGESKL